MESIGVREIRQHASRYLRRVEAGESFEITARGRPVAVILPVTDALRDGVRALVEALVTAGAYPSVEAALEAGVEALARDLHSTIVDAAIVEGYTTMPDDHDPWAEEAATLTFREMDHW